METDFDAGIEAYFDRLKTAIDLLSRDQVNTLARLLREAREQGRTVFIMGNGGSAATASHFAVDFNKGLSHAGSRRFRVLCLNDGIPALTACANDMGYERVFVEPLQNFLETGDLVIAISGSGNSANVLEAVRYANDRGAVTVGLTGFDGGRLREIAHHGVHVPLDDMQVTEDLHLVVTHVVYSVLGAQESEEGVVG